MNTIKMTFLGDIMMPNEIISIYLTSNGYNFNNIFDGMANFLSKSDYVIGNLETPISNLPEDMNKKKFSFTAPSEFVNALKNSGIDFVSTANNHCLDNGEDGINKTIDCLNNFGIKHTGIFKDKPFVENVMIGNIKVCFLAYTYGTNAFYNNYYLHKRNRVNLIQEQELHNFFMRRFFYSKNRYCKFIRRLFEKMKLFQLDKPVFERNENSFFKRIKIKKDIYKAKRFSDLVIVLLHDGGQYNENPITRKIKNCDFFIKNGVDFVVCNHEHVINKIDKIRSNRYNVAYSLGNYTSINGVYEPPFDVFAEYSIALNMYCDENTKKIVKLTYTILKIIKDGNSGIAVFPLYDLIYKEKNNSIKKMYIDDYYKIVSKISGNSNSIDLSLEVELQNIEKMTGEKSV